mgnify:FL=1
MVMLPWNEQRQAKWLLRRLLMDLSHDLELISYFHTVDLLNYDWGNGPTDYNQRLGVLRGEDYSPKPSYFAYQSLCTLFDSQTRHEANLAIMCNGAPDETFQSVGFSRNGCGVYAWWSAVDLFEDYAPRTISLQVSTRENATLQQPVLIDPMSQQVYRLTGKTTGHDKLTFDRLPLRDYPLIVTDRSVVRVEG